MFHAQKLFLWMESYILFQILNISLLSDPPTHSIYRNILLRFNNVIHFVYIYPMKVVIKT
jgi:hypothetical protein